MILISPPNISDIAKKHYQFVSPEILKRVDFYLWLFDALGNNNTLPANTVITNKLSLEWTSIYALIDHLLKAIYKKNGNNLNINQQDVNAIFLNSEYSKIDNNLDAATFRSLHVFFTTVKNNLEKIIIANPFELNEFIVNGTFDQQTGTVEKKCIENSFRYEEFTQKGFEINGVKWNSYKLTSALNLSVCPYCNRSWIITINNDEDGSKIVNPQLDHYLCKVEYPLFRLSFYNLIPSCDTCNTRLKKREEFKYNKNLHPFEDCYVNKAFFRTIALNAESSIGDGTDFKVNLEFGLITKETKIKINNNNEMFKINQIYEKHGDLIAEIYKIKHIYTENYLGKLRLTLNGFNLSNEEVYKLAFGNYFNESDFKKRPFAKLTKDIATQLGLIKNNLLNC